MGLFISHIMDRLAGPKKRSILMLGLDAAGKTTVLYKLKINEAVHTVPTCAAHALVKPSHNQV
jgi:GTPase SAR1 family protein